MAEIQPRQSAHKSSKSSQPRASAAAEAVLAWVPWLEIAHQTRGRVRIRFARAPTDHPLTLDATVAQGLRDIERLLQILRALPGVKDISINLLTRSCVVNYDPQIIPDPAWPELLDGNLSGDARVLIRLLGTVLSTV